MSDEEKEQALMRSDRNSDLWMFFQAPTEQARRAKRRSK
jgi:hypothetical protein